MVNIKIPNVAGTFYPDRPEVLREMIRQFMEGKATEGVLPQAIIAPHAGYRYSGKVAGSAYACLKNGREIFKRVILLGTAHRLYFEGLAVSTAEFFETPLGNVRVDTAAAARAASLPFVKFLDEAFEEEHSVEVQLPFLQESLDDFSIVPLLVGDGPPEQVAQVIELLKEDERSVVVVSSDLSHFLSETQARALDAQTTELIERLAFEGLDGKKACGFYPIRGLLYYARKHGFKVKTVHLSNSGEETGDLFRVVGYGAYVFS
jgi:MEMO1 family protein